MDALDPSDLLHVLTAFQRGDFSVRLPVDRTGAAGRAAATLNEIFELNENTWKQCERIFTEVARIIAAVAQGDLSQKMVLDVDGPPLQALRTAGMLNAMLDQLASFASEVTRVAREVGADGKSGGQAEVKDLAGVWKDLTDSVRSMAGNLTAQARKREAEAARAESANRAKDEFLATVSHELRTPLTAVLGWIRLLRTRELDADTVAQALETIERNARVQAQLIEDILDVSRVITGKLRIDVRPVDLAGVIQAAVDAVRPAAEANAIQIETELDSRAGPVPGDPDRLQQVVWNLLSNAVKFTPAGGRVKVQLKRVNSQARIEVTDSGRGISPGFLPHVFERFRQADASHTRSHGGLGLGLAIVRHLVELHGGKVQASSPGDGKGATFSISIPSLVVSYPLGRPGGPEPAHSEAVAAASLWGARSLDGLHVLVVEDQADTREVLTSVLGHCGAQVTAVASAAEAMEALSRVQPDVLLSDIQMPNEDGYSLIRQVRALEAQRGGFVPAAALTAHVRPADRLRALAAGFQMHVPKPVEPAELVAVVASLAGRSPRTANRI